MAVLVLTDNGLPVREYPLDSGRTTLGRADDNDIAVADRAVSAHHAVFIREDRFVRIEDLASTNGTFVNGRRTTRSELRDGDIVRVGNHEIRFSARDPGHEPEQPFETTMVMDARTAGRVAPAAMPESPAPSSSRMPMARLQVLSGPNSGRELRLAKALTTLGRPGVQVAAITRRADGYAIVYVPSSGDRGTAPTVNGKSIGNRSCYLKDNDVIELAGVKMGFFCD
ncbi:MAG TPA: FHA domain-containing protein [Gammaproteobacteria bacterium]|nr:FHA domain-containing protein [Gammaproteobacteria bacterium]